MAACDRSFEVPSRNENGTELSQVAVGVLLAVNSLQIFLFDQYVDAFLRRK